MYPYSQHASGRPLSAKHAVYLSHNRIMTRMRVMFVIHIVTSIHDSMVHGQCLSSASACLGSHPYLHGTAHGEHHPRLADVSPLLNACASSDMSPLIHALLRLTSHASQPVPTQACLCLRQISWQPTGRTRHSRPPFRVVCFVLLVNLVGRVFSPNPCVLCRVLRQAVVPRPVLHARDHLGHRLGRVRGAAQGTRGAGGCVTACHSGVSL